VRLGVAYSVTSIDLRTHNTALGLLHLKVGAPMNNDPLMFEVLRE
jgi:hypothetical protein